MSASPSGEGLAPDVASLLARHGVRGEERPLAHDGFSGAQLTEVDCGSERWMLKRINAADDWMMRVTGDAHCREAEFAVSPLVRALPAGVAVPSVGAARDGDGWALLMRDIAPALFRVPGVLDGARADLALRRIAELHAASLGGPLHDARIHFCGSRERLSLLAPATGRMLIDEGRDFGIAAGWRLFEKRAPGAAVRLVRALQADPAPLLHLAASLPATLLHGDAKAANMGVDGDGTLWLIDWALVSHGPVGIELGWLLSVNAGVLPWPPGETLGRYGAHLERALGAGRFDGMRWEDQCRVVYLSGLLLGGWSKALDDEAGRPDELRWWCDRAAEAASQLGW